MHTLRSGPIGVEVYFGIEAAAQAVGVLLQCALMYRIHVRTPPLHAALSAYAGLVRSFVRASCKGAQAASSRAESSIAWSMAPNGAACVRSAELGVGVGECVGQAQAGEKRRDASPAAVGAHLPRPHHHEDGNAAPHPAPRCPRHRSLPAACPFRLCAAAGRDRARPRRPVPPLCLTARPLAPRGHARSARCHPAGFGCPPSARAALRMRFRRLRRAQDRT